MKLLKRYIDGIDAGIEADKLLNDLRPKDTPSTLEYFNHENSDGKTIVLYGCLNNIVAIATILRDDGNHSILRFDDLKD